MTGPNIILDCDPGLDDAFAIFTAVEHTNVVGITSVAGNVGIDFTTRNALLVLEAAGAEVPVYRGAAGPLTGPTVEAAHVHGATGLGDLDREPATEIAGDDAVGFILDAAESTNDLWLVAVGPLTNIAEAVQRRSDLVDQVAGLTIMGGAARGGNSTPAAEFNIYADPEAAHVVFEAGFDLTMIGLDVTQQVRMGHSQMAQLEAADAPRSRLAAALLDFYGRSRIEARDTGDGAMHHPCAVLVITHPELFSCTDRHVAVETAGTLTRGMTVVDERLESRVAPNCRVGYGVDAAEVIDLIMGAATR